MARRNLTAAFALTGVACVAGACGTAPPAEALVEQTMLQIERVALHVDKMT